jgi:hypothetical protein
MKNLAIFWISMFLTILVVPVLVDAATYTHTIVKPNMAGMSVSIPVDANVWSCVYVTDCKEPPTTAPAPPPPVISDIPTPRGAPGWTFGVLMDRNGWTVEVDSVEESDTTKKALYKKEHLIDDDISTIFHTSWVTPVPPPHWVIIDMGGEHWVDGMLLTPRHYDPAKSWSATNSPEDYEVWVSNNYVAAHLDDKGSPVASNGIWARVANGVLTYDPIGSTQTIPFLIPNFARYIKLVSLTCTGGTPSLAIGDIQVTESVRDTVEITGGAVQ